MTRKRRFKNMLQPKPANRRRRARADTAGTHAWKPITSHQPLKTRKAAPSVPDRLSAWQASNPSGRVVARSGACPALAPLPVLPPAFDACQTERTPSILLDTKVFDGESRETRPTGLGPLGPAARPSPAVAGGD